MFTENFYVLQVLLLSTASILADDSVNGKARQHKEPQQQNDVLSNNGHQKPPSTKFESLQQQTQPTQPPVYPVPLQNPQQVDAYQQYSYLPQAQALPQYAYQPVSMPKFQLISTKDAQGQTQLSLIPHSVFTSHVGYATVPQVAQQAIPQPLPSNQIQQDTQNAHVSSSYQTGGVVNFVTPQPPVASSQSSVVPLTQAYYSNQQAPLAGYSHLAAAQPFSNNYIYSQPSPQAYSYTPSHAGNLYAAAGPHSLSYYQGNPQAKYQYVYGNHLQQRQPLAYQSAQAQSPQASPPAEYEKYSYAQQPAQPTQKSDAISPLSLNTNEYISQHSTNFRPMIPQSRGQYYKY